jgi:hypothetical protein
MKLGKAIRGTLVTLTCLSMLTGQLARAAVPAAAEIRDVALQSAGILNGQVLDKQGAPQSQTQVAVVKDGQVAATAFTDSSGRFEVGNLSGGIYQIHTAKGFGIYRVWAPRTAPPAAQEGVLIVEGDEVVRGNVWQHLANPWLLALIVVCAIAIPLAATADDDDASG